MQPLSPTQSRTRAAIIEATAAVLANNRTATIPLIAQAAGVGRTTVHRYFPDRENLIYHATMDSIEIVHRLAILAATDQGTAIEALHRMVDALVSVSDRVVFLFGDPAVLSNIPPEDQPDDAPVMDVIKRGQAEGALDPELSATWIEHAFFALILQGCEDLRSGDLPRHAVAPTIVRTFQRGVRAPD